MARKETAQAQQIRHLIGEVQYLKEERGRLKGVNEKLENENSFLREIVQALARSLKMISIN